MGYLRVASGESLRLAGVDLPGVVTAIEVDGENVIEQHRREGQSGDVYVAKGYRDRRVRITLELAPPNEQRQVAVLEGVFAKHKATPMRVVNPHLDARGIEKTLFNRLISRETGGRNGISCVIELSQIEPREALAERNQQAAQTASGGVAGGGANAATGQGGGTTPTTSANAGAVQPKVPDYLNDFINGRRTFRDLVE